MKNTRKKCPTTSTDQVVIIRIPGQLREGVVGKNGLESIVKKGGSGEKGGYNYEGGRFSLLGVWEWESHGGPIIRIEHNIRAVDGVEKALLRT